MLAAVSSGARRLALSTVNRFPILDELALAFAPRVQAPGFTGVIVDRINALRRSAISNPVVDGIMFTDVPQHEWRLLSSYTVSRWLFVNAAKVNKAAALLADDKSREILAEVFAYRALGPKFVELEKASSFCEHEREAKAFLQGESNYRFPPYKLSLYEFPVESHKVSVECWLANVYATVTKQYLFSRGGTRIQPEAGDVVIDAGACFGDTALIFAALVGETGFVHSFEPLAGQREIFEANLRRNPVLAERVKIHPFALDRVAGKELFFDADAGAGARASAGSKTPVLTTRIDDLVEQQGLDRVDFIKMDIEGAETAALEGAAGTIRRFKPKLGISIYHSLDDLVSIPALVAEMVPGYRLYVDHYSIYDGETVLYAIAE